MKIVLGILLAHDFPVPAAFVKSYSHLLQTLLTGAGNAILPKNLAIDSMNVTFCADFPIDYARNKICRIFLDNNNADYLLFLDSDMTHPPDLPHRLVRHGLDVVTGRYVIRKPPYFSVAMRKTGAGPTDYDSIEKLTPDGRLTGLIPIDGGGAGALLISRRCLTDIRERIGDDWFRYQDGPDGLRSRSEDMWFYEQAIAAGHEPWLDADVWCGHESRTIVGPKDHEPFAEAWRAAMNKPGDNIQCPECFETYTSGLDAWQTHRLQCKGRTVPA